MTLVTATAERDGAVAVAVAGELDVLSAPKLAAALRDALIHYRSCRVEVDLGEVSFMDSTGIQVLVAANGDATAAGGGVTVVRASPQVLRVLRLTGLLDALGLADST